MADKGELINSGGGYVKVTRHPRNSVTSFGFVLVTAAFNVVLAVPSIAQSQVQGYVPPKRVAHQTEFQQVFYNPVNVTPTPATLTITRFAPAVSTPRNVIPGSESLITTVYAPTVTASDHKNVLPGSAALSTTTFAPTVTVGTAWTPQLFQNIYGEQTAKRKALAYRYSLLSSGFSTNATGNRNVEPPSRSLTITTFAPTVTVGAVDNYTPAKFQNIVSERTRAKKRYDPRREYHRWSFGLTDARLVIPAIEQLAQSYRTKARFRQAPLIQPQFGWRSPNNVEVVPATATLTTTSFAPTVTISGNQEVTPGSATLTITRFAPTITAPRNVTPGAATLSITRFAPNVATPREVIPGSSTLTATRFAPTVVATAHINAVPGAALVTLSTLAPTVTVQQQNPTVTPAPAVLTMATYAPIVAVGATEPAIIFYGGDDAPKKRKKRKEPEPEDLFRQIEQTIHELISYRPIDAGEIHSTSEPSASILEDLERHYAALAGLAEGQHALLQRAAAIRAEIAAYEAHQALLEQDEEDALIWMF